MLGKLHSSLSQHNIGEDPKQTSLEFSASLQPYKTPVETFPSTLVLLISLVKHRWLDLQTACGQDGELQKHNIWASEVK